MINSEGLFKINQRRIPVAQYARRQLCNVGKLILY